MLVGRLGLEIARLPHSDRHGLVFLDRGRLTVEDGCLTFDCAGGGMAPAGRYGLPHQSVSLILIGPGSTVSHDALRLLARHNVGLAAVGADGVRFYTAQPLLPHFSHLARAQARHWADERRERPLVARRMYALRLGEVLPHRDIAVLRGIEGARMKETYRIEAQKAGIPWHGRRYDRQNPDAADLPNQALNHAASAVEAAAAIAVAATATIPQLGFIHEDSGRSFVLDVADLVRDTVTIPVAFKAAVLAKKRPQDGVERITRRMAGERLKRDDVIATLIDRIKTVAAAPPPTQGSTPLALPVPHVLPGSPARAGIDPRNGGATRDQKELPRPCGDRPRPSASGGRRATAPPPTRGSTRGPDRDRQGGRGFPAHAGIDPASSRIRSRAGWLPRLREDRPTTLVVQHALMATPSPTRGSTQSRADAEGGGTGSPAQAGIDPGGTASR